MNTFTKTLALIAVALGCGMVSAGGAWAEIPVSSITQESVPIYGAYTTSDATCQTGLVVGVPLSKTPQTLDMLKSPTIGSGGISNPINCVIMVLGGEVTESWSSGSYTTTSNGGNSDSVCNSGGSGTSAICHSGVAPSWPSRITTDAAAVGLTLTTSCANNSTDVLPVYISVDSTVTSPNGSDHPFSPPTGPGDATNGIKLPAAGVPAASLTFVMDPTGTIGNTVSGSPLCGSTNPPLFSFHN